MKQRLPPHLIWNISLLSPFCQTASHLWPCRFSPPAVREGKAAWFEPPPGNLEILVTLAHGNTSVSSTPVVSSVVPSVSTRRRHRPIDNSLTIMFNFKYGGNVLSFSHCKECGTNTAHAGLWMQFLHLVIIRIKTHCHDQPMPELFTRSSISTCLILWRNWAFVDCLEFVSPLHLWSKKKKILKLMQLFICNLQTYESCEKDAPTKNIILKLLSSFTCVLYPWAFPDLSRS